MPPILSVPLLALIAVVQITLVPQIPVFGCKPDLALVLIVAWAIVAPFGEAALWGFVIGLFLDLASGLPFGINTLTLTTIGLLIGWGQATFFHGNLLAPPAAMALATIVQNVIALGLLSLFQWHIDWTSYLLRVTLPSAILNAAVLPLMYLPLRTAMRRLRPELDYLG